MVRRDRALVASRLLLVVPASRLVSVAWDACFCHGTGALPVSEKDGM
jgi:hypothetical protein